MSSFQDTEKKERSLSKKLGIGCLGFLGITFLLGVIGAALEDPEDRARREAEASDKAAKEAAVSKELAKEEAVAWYSEVIEISKPCDQQFTTLQSQFSEFDSVGDLYTIYQTATVTRDACDASWESYRNLDAPSSFNDEVKEKAKETKDRCGNAYFAKRQFAELAMEIADGDMKPSKVQEARQYAEAGGAGVLACVAGAMGTALSAGVPAEELTPVNE